MRHVAAVSRPLRCLRQLPGPVCAPSSSPAVRASSSSLSAHQGPGWQLLSPTRRATTVLAQLLADVCHPGDVVCLHGGVGTGKSFFCREFVRAVTDDPLLSVPSPTFLLLQTYETALSSPVHHFDLYRLTSHESLGNLDLQDSFSRAVSLIEWADRLGPLTPERRLEVHIKEAAAYASSQPQQHDDENDGEVDDIRAREVVLRPYGQKWEQAVAAVASFVSAPPPQTPSLGGLRVLGCE